MLVRWPKISAAKNRWVVDLPAAYLGKRVRKYFATRDLAEIFLEGFKENYKENGRRGFELSDAQRVEAQNCFVLLEKFPAGTLRKAVDEFLARNTPSGKTVNDALEVYLRDKKGKVSQHHLEETVRDTKRFIKFLGKDVALEAVRVEDLKNFVASLGEISSATKKYRIKHIGLLLSLGVQHSWCKENLVSRLKFEFEPRKPPAVFSVAEVKKILAVSLEKREWEFTAFFVIGLFAGLRVCEIKRLRWENIHLENGENHIEVIAKNAKTSERRIVSIQPNLRKWLLLVKGEALFPKKFQSRRLAIGFLAGLPEWENQLRHSFATYFLQKFQSIDKTKVELGHWENSAELRRHYRNIVSPLAADEYWEIVPPL